MDKLKLKANQEVIYFDGISILDKTSVIEISKEQGIAKLANGITLQIESTKKGYFKRYGIRRSEAKAWVSDKDNEGTRMYQAYIAKARIKKQLPLLLKAVDSKTITFDKDQAYLVELNKIISEFLS